MNNQPAHIDIVFEDHVYTATVYDVIQLRQFCRECVRNKRVFRFGSIHQYGSVNLDRLCRMMNEISYYGTYDRWLGI